MRLLARDKLRLAQAAYQKDPTFAPMHLEYGKVLGDGGFKADSETAFRQGLKCAAESDVKTCLLVNLAVAATRNPLNWSVTDSRQEQERVYREAVDLNGNLASAAMARLGLLALTAGPSS